jgi:hypothetical protein
MTEQLKDIKIVLRWDEWTLDEIRTFMRQAGKHPQEYLSDKEGFEALILDPDAAGAYVWVGSHRDDPALTVEAVMERVTPADMVAAVNAAGEALGLKGKIEEEPAPPPPKARKGRAS